MIGKTPLRLFDAARDPVFLFSPGDHIRFYVIGEEEFLRNEDDRESRNPDPGNHRFPRMNQIRTK